MIKKVIIGLVAILALAGCEAEKTGDTVVNNYEAEAGGVVLILNNDGSKECYNTGAESNGSECAQDTYIEFTFDGTEEAAEAEADAELEV